VASRRLLESALQLLLTFPGCLVLVTHDAVLAEKLATRRLTFEAGKLRVS
jgi:ATPase subunit of ABC transporter with duplicated ATPase domains